MRLAEREKGVSNEAGVWGEGGVGWVGLVRLEGRASAGLIMYSYEDLVYFPPRRRCAPRSPGGRREVTRVLTPHCL